MDFFDEIRVLSVTSFLLSQYFYHTLRPPDSYSERLSKFGKFVYNGYVVGKLELPQLTVNNWNDERS